MIPVLHPFLFLHSFHGIYLSLNLSFQKLYNIHICIFMNIYWSYTNTYTYTYTYTHTYTCTYTSYTFHHPVKSRCFLKIWIQRCYPQVLQSKPNRSLQLGLRLPSCRWFCGSQTAGSSLENTMTSPLPLHHPFPVPHSWLNKKGGMLVYRPFC